MAGPSLPGNSPPPSPPPLPSPNSPPPSLPPSALHTSTPPSPPRRRPGKEPCQPSPPRRTPKRQRSPSSPSSPRAIELAIKLGQLAIQKARGAIESAGRAIESAGRAMQSARRAIDLARHAIQSAMAPAEATDPFAEPIWSIPPPIGWSPSVWKVKQAFAWRDRARTQLNHDAKRVDDALRHLTEIKKSEINFQKAEIDVEGYKKSEVLYNGVIERVQQIINEINEHQTVTLETVEQLRILVDAGYHGSVSLSSWDNYVEIGHAALVHGINIESVAPQNPESDSPHNS